MHYYNLLFTYFTLRECRSSCFTNLHVTFGILTLLDLKRYISPVSGMPCIPTPFTKL